MFVLCTYTVIRGYKFCQWVVIESTSSLLLKEQNKMFKSSMFAPCFFVSWPYRILFLVFSDWFFSQTHWQLVGWQILCVWCPWSRLVPGLCELWPSLDYKSLDLVSWCYPWVSCDVLTWKMLAFGADTHLGLYCCSHRALASSLNPQMVPLCWNFLTWCNLRWLACLGLENPRVEADSTC